MSVLITLLTTDPSVYVPQSLVGRLIAGLSWLLFLGLLVLLLRRWRGYNAPSTPKTRLLLVLLALAVPITSLFFGLRLPVQGSLPPPWAAGRARWTGAHVLRRRPLDAGRWVVRSAAGCPVGRGCRDFPGFVGYP